MDDSQEGKNNSVFVTDCSFCGDFTIYTSFYCDKWNWWIFIG